MQNIPRYPVLLVHGMGFRDEWPVNYWGRIPKLLQQAGVQVYYGGQDSHGTNESNARHLRIRLRQVLAESGADRVHIIAHSKGGLDARWLISHLDQGQHVASLTTLATPHRGSRTVDWLLQLPDWMVRLAGWWCNVFYRVAGDATPDSYHVFRDLTTRRMQAFNADTPDVPGVHYQSYAFAMRGPLSDVLLWFPFLVVRAIEGKNDGLVAEWSARWGEYRGCYTGAGWRGVSHDDVVDLRRRPLRRKPAAERYTISDIADVYRDIVQTLAAWEG